MNRKKSIEMTQMSHFKSHIQLNYAFCIISCKIWLISDLLKAISNGKKWRIICWYGCFFLSFEFEIVHLFRLAGTHLLMRICWLAFKMDEFPVLFIIIIPTYFGMIVRFFTIYITRCLAISHVWCHFKVGTSIKIRFSYSCKSKLINFTSHDRIHTHTYEQRAKSKSETNKSIQIFARMYAENDMIL